MQGCEPLLLGDFSVVPLLPQRGSESQTPCMLHDGECGCLRVLGSTVRLVSLPGSPAPSQSLPGRGRHPDSNPEEFLLLHQMVDGNSRVEEAGNGRPFAEFWQGRGPRGSGKAVTDVAAF